MIKVMQKVTTTCLRRVVYPADQKLIELSVKMNGNYYKIRNKQLLKLIINSKQRLKKRTLKL